MSDNNKLIITVSVTGGIGDAGTPYLPITPKQIAEGAIEAGEAGASVAHIHVRDPETGVSSMDFKLYKEVSDRIRDHSDILINLTTGPGARVIPDNNEPVGLAPGSTLCQPQKRLEHVLQLKPELCSLDVGSMDFGSHVFVNYIEHVEWMAEQIRDAGVAPELEVFTLGHTELAKHLIDTERVKSPPLFQLCMGIPWGIPATSLNMIAMVQALPDNAVWAGFGISASCFSMLAQATILGGNVRVGMEDNLYLEKGVRAKTNKELVEKAAAIVRLLGKEPATPDEARELMKLGVD
ncbi:MAG: 3-keto-5-aminohexanoate cleavage protein [Desulfobacterales bacterium]|nr:3-keto-5-aminohexanoate cleavage protein [Desulfobacterales bacterium]